MNKRLLYLMFLCLAFTMRTSAQTPTTYTFYCPEVSLIPTAQSNLPNTLLGVVIESWHYDPADKIVILHLVNNSGKDVTAYNISIAEKYADGTTNYADGRAPGIHDHQMMEDFLGRLINFQLGMKPSGVVIPGAVRREKDRIMYEQMRQNTSGNGTFAAGTSRDHIDFVSKDVSDIDAVVAVVAYSDGTADVLNNDRAFRNLVAERKGSVLAMQKVVEVVKRVLADPMVSDPISAALNELLPFAELLEANTKNGSPEVAENNVARNLQNDIRNLQYMQREKLDAQRDSLARYVVSQEKLIALMAPHANLSVNVANAKK